MLDDGERLVPGFRQARALRVWPGVRPLFEDAQGRRRTDTRDVSRAHAVVDHSSATASRAADDHRRQADDLPADGRGPRRRDVPAARRRAAVHDGRRGAARARRTAAPTRSASACARARRRCSDEQLVCECELIARRRLEETIRARAPATNLDDIRRCLRLGMGPCQGGFCIYRARPASCTASTARRRRAGQRRRCCGFLQERWKGVWPILYGDQLRQARLDDWIFQGVLDVGAPARSSARRAVSTTTSSWSAPGSPGSRRRSRLAEAGARVLVLAKGVGATHLSPGTIDVLGYAPERVESPREALAGFAAARPDHPYALLGRRAVARRARVVRRQGAGGPLPATATPASLDENLLLPTARRRAAARRRSCRRACRPATCGRRRRGLRRRARAR